MTQPNRLTDRTALNMHRARATEDALFLHETARDEIQDRLPMVNRTFKDVAIVTPFPQIWHGSGMDARIVADDDVLDLPTETFDLVIHAMALHWANDPVGQIIQARRALRPDGLFMAACLGGQTLQELRAALGQAEAEVTGGMSPRIAPMGEIRDLGALLQRSGLALPVADALPLTTSYATPLALMHELRAMGENNALDARLRHPTRSSVLKRATEIYSQNFAEENGRITATFELIFLHGWAPDESQPKPLRPGSAAMRLADALNTKETPLND